MSGYILRSSALVFLPSSFGDLCQHDMGTGLPFRPATFDGCISVSALQVRCCRENSEARMQFLHVDGIWGDCRQSPVKLL